MVIKLNMKTLTEEAGEKAEDANRRFKARPLTHTQALALKTRAREAGEQPEELKMYREWNKFLKAIEPEFFRVRSNGTLAPIASWGRLDQNKIASVVPYPPLRTTNAFAHPRK